MKSLLFLPLFTLLFIVLSINSILFFAGAYEGTSIAQGAEAHSCSNYTYWNVFTPGLLVGCVVGKVMGQPWN